MRILTNARLAGRNRRIAQYMFFVSLGVPMAGLLLINMDMKSPTALLFSSILPFIVLPLAYVVMIVSIRMTNLWVREPRPEAAIQAGLKGISNKSVLYNYIFMPVRHVLITPQGVFSMTTRFQEGMFACHGSTWTSNRRGTARLMTLLRMDSIGNPTADALKAKAKIEDLLKEIAPGVTVQPLIVFVDPKVGFEAIDPEVPVLHAVNKDLPNLKDYLQSVASEKLPTLTAEQIEAFERAYIPR
ncbi:MAG: nuclease-related domain-containing protein [Anaerolineae bacterium]